MDEQTVRRARDLFRSIYFSLMMYFFFLLLLRKGMQVNEFENGAPCQTMLLNICVEATLRTIGLNSGSGFTNSCQMLGHVLTSNQRSGQYVTIDDHNFEVVDSKLEGE